MEENNETVKLQKEIRFALKTLNWSQCSFAETYHIDNAAYDPDEEEIKRSVDRFKSYLKRPKTLPEKLMPYLLYLKKSDRYMKFDKDSPGTLKNYDPSGRVITTYEEILDDEDDPTNKKVLGVAAAFALSIGDAWDFHVVKISEEEYEYHFVVIWQGDIGRHWGSGTFGAAMCEVTGFHMNRLSVVPTDGSFEIGTRFIQRVIGYENQQLTLVGLFHDDNDEIWLPNLPTLAYRITLMKDEKGKWVIIKKQFEARIDIEEHIEIKRVL